MVEGNSATETQNNQQFVVICNHPIIYKVVQGTAWPPHLNLDTCAAAQLSSGSSRLQRRLPQSSTTKARPGSTGPPWAIAWPPLRAASPLARRCAAASSCTPPGLRFKGKQLLLSSMTMQALCCILQPTDWLQPLQSVDDCLKSLQFAMQSCVQCTIDAWQTGVWQQSRTMPWRMSASSLSPPCWSPSTLSHMDGTTASATSTVTAAPRMPPPNTTCDQVG